MNMLPKEEINKYGGKGAILNHVKSKLPEMPVPPYTILESGDNLDSILKDFNSMKKPVIVRSSSPHEYGDFEGIFKSVQDVGDEGNLSWAIKAVKESAISERATIYAKQNGFQINEQMHVVIQEQSESRYHGAMMRHPNNPNLIFISYYSLARLRHHESLVFDDNAFDEAEPLRSLYNKMPVDHGRALVENYRKIESLSDIADGYSLFVEFGFEPFALYQVRPFKKIETADFQIPDKYKNDVEKWTNFTFGITSKDGIVLPILKGVSTRDAKFLSTDLGKKAEILHGDYDEKLKQDLNVITLMMLEEVPVPEKMISDILSQHNFYTGEQIKEPYCYITPSAQREGYDVDLSVPNMEGLILSGVDTFLVHDLIRLFKKANIVAGFPSVFHREFYISARSVEDKVRIISNGIEAVVLKE